jgi:hypothetical protein
LIELPPLPEPPPEEVTHPVRAPIERSALMPSASERMLIISQAVKIS